MNRYKRRDNDLFVLHKDIKLENKWVVPYNPYLILKYQAHINVEICSTIASVKYLYKYIDKGYDCANIQIENENNKRDYDEINNFLSTRYFGFNCKILN